MDKNTLPIFNRKDEHIALSLDEEINNESDSMFECINLIHNALPELNFNEIDTKTNFLGKNISIPLIISSLTGGTSLGKKINTALAEAAHNNNIAMMVGSQRIALEHPETIESFSVVRLQAPDIPIIANIGIPQLINSLNFNSIEKIIKMIEADAIAIHLNSLQEIIQPEGEPIFDGGLEKIIEVADKIKIPVIIKETGSGISKETAEKLFKNGIKIIDVSGFGGTNWAVIENSRAKKQNNQKPEGDLNDYRTNFGKIYNNWGIPTAASIIEVQSLRKKYNDVTIIGSGGIRSGLDMARSLSIGADLIGIAKPFLQAAMNQKGSIDKLIKCLSEELKATMFLTGNKTMNELKKTPKIIFPPLKTWLESRNIL